MYRKFLNLDYYNQRDIYIPPYFLPVKERKLENYVGLLNLCKSSYGKAVYDKFLDNEDYTSISDCITSHVFFSDKFIHEQLKERIKNKLINKGLNSIFALYINHTRFKTEKALKRNFVNDISRDLCTVLLYNLYDESIYQKLNF